MDQVLVWGHPVKSIAGGGIGQLQVHRVKVFRRTVPLVEHGGQAQVDAIVPKHRHRIDLGFKAIPPDNLQRLAPVDKVPAGADGGDPHPITPGAGDDLKEAVHLVPEGEVVGIRRRVPPGPGDHLPPVDAVLGKVHRHIGVAAGVFHLGHQLVPLGRVCLLLVQKHTGAVGVAEEHVVLPAALKFHQPQAGLHPVDAVVAFRVPQGGDAGGHGAIIPLCPLLPGGGGGFFVLGTEGVVAAVLFVLGVVDDIGVGVIVAGLPGQRGGAEETLGKQGVVGGVLFRSGQHQAHVFHSLGLEAAAV